jgi:hypothetical protein
MIETQTEKPTVTIAIPSWILSVGKLIDYAAKTASAGTKAAVEGIKSAAEGQSADQSNDEKTNGISEEKPAEDKTPLFKKFKFQFKKPNFSLFKKLRPDKVKEIKAKVWKHPKIALAVLAVILVGTFLVIRFQGKTQNVSLGASSLGNFSPSKEVTINKQFNVPIRTNKGDESGDNLKITLTTVENTNKILIQGQPATARDGKSFLILNLEVENSTKNQLTVRPVDLIRMIDTAGKSYAPDIHNNDVTVEAISIKKTRAGYVIDNNQKHFKFLIGEVTGKKEAIEVDLN